MIERYFEGEVPPQFTNLERALLRLGASFHRSTSGRYIKIDEDVSNGDIVEASSGKVKDLPFVTRVWHTHGKHYYTRDGVPVRVKQLPLDEADELEDEMYQGY